MKKVYKEDIVINSSLGYGAYSDVLECTYNQKKFAYKRFLTPTEIIDEKFIYRMDKINELKEYLKYIPLYWVYDEFGVIGYLVEKADAKDLSSKGEDDILTKINILKEAKKKILFFHSLGLIHADIHSGNIIIDEEPHFIDYDNASYKSLNPCEYNYSKDAYQYIKKYGVNSDIDVFLFNLLTYGFLNNVDSMEIPIKIYNQEFGFFDNKNGRKVCKSLWLDDDVFNNEFLIDNIDSESLERNCKKMSKSKDNEKLYIICNKAF